MKDKNKYQYQIFLLAILIAMFVAGCKTGGLFQMNEDVNKPLIPATIKGVTSTLNISLPFEMTDTGKDEPIPADVKEYVTKAQRFSGHNKDMVVTIVSVNYKKELLDTANANDLKEVLKVAADEDVQNMKQHKGIQNLQYKIEEGSADGNPALLVNITYKNGKNNMKGKCIYTMKSCEAWCIICEYMDSDNVMEERAKEVINSIKLN